MSSRLLAPYSPTRENPWNSRTAAFLLRRAGFGCTTQEIDDTVAAGVGRTVNKLLDEAPDQEAELQATFDRIVGPLISDVGDVQVWWVYRMLRSTTPLREKLTLFWHGHFATSIAKVGDAHLLHQQIETIRANAWGNYRDLTLAIAKDPAMLVYLDGESSTKEHPNENFARELMELFTCGIGHYTEHDVLEAARAFTGWHRNGTEFSLNADAHDGGQKTFLGRTGNFDGTDIINSLIQLPATSHFIARKLLRFFAAPEPSPEVVTEAAMRLVEVKWNIKEFLRTLFLSKYFFSAECYRTRITSPAELVIGTVRTLGCQIAARTLRDHMTMMGQNLLAPPNVKGWSGEEEWINTSSWAARLGFAQGIADLQGFGRYDPNLPLDQVVAADIKDPKRIVELLAARLMQGELSAEARRELAQFLVTTEQGREPNKINEDDQFRLTQTRKTLAAMLSLAEYHRC